MGFIDIDCGNRGSCGRLEWVGIRRLQEKSWYVFLPSSCSSSLTSLWLREMLLIPSIPNSTQTIIKTNLDGIYHHYCHPTYISTKPHCVEGRLASFPATPFLLVIIQTSSPARPCPIGLSFSRHPLLQP